MADTALLYEFSPDKVSVSLGGDNAIDSLIDLHVKINSRGEAAMVGGITITIPMGENDGSRLSANPILPDPVYDHTAMDGWTIEIDEVNKSIVHINPVPKTRPKALASTIEFTLQDILVNKTVGVVPITVDEFAPAHAKANFQINKEDADRPVKKFYVTDSSGQELNPPVLYDLDEQVKLKWDCTAEGINNYSFGLHTAVGETWTPKDCLSRRDCYSCQDGTSGVLTNELSQTTTFALEVIKTDGVRRRLHSILYATVRVEMPIIRSKTVRAKYFKGRVVALRWKVDNATRCEVQVGGVVIDDKAPTDTYKDGYLAPIAGGPGTYTPSLTAYARTGTATDADPFPPVSVDPLRLIDTGAPWRSLAISPDGRWGLGASGLEEQVPNLSLIDLSATSPAARVLPINWTIPPAWPPSVYNVAGLAFTPDGSRALALVVMTKKARAVWRIETKGYTSFIVILDTATWQPRGGGIVIRDSDYFNPLAVPSTSRIAVTANGQSALVANCEVTVIDIAANAVKGKSGGDLTALAVTPDGALMFSGVFFGTGSFAGTSGVYAEAVPPPQNSWPLAGTSNSVVAMAATSDSRALVLFANTQQVSIVGIQRPSSLVTTGTGPNSIAMTTGTQDAPERAVVANEDGTLTVIRVSDLAVTQVPLDPGMRAGPVVISKTGGLNNHGVGLIVNNNNLIRFDVDDLPWSAR